MHKLLSFASYGWLVLGGLVHFGIDVLSQRLRGTRVPGPETTLYYGLHSSFAFGQIAFGLLCLWLGWAAPELLARPPLTAISFAAGLGWLAIASGFITYWQPKLIASIYLALLVVAAVAK